MDIGLCGRLDYRTSGVMLMTDDAILNRAIRDPPRLEFEEDCEDGEDSAVIDKKESQQLQDQPFDKELAIENKKEEEGNEESVKELDDNEERYMEYKSKVYLVKVAGERLNELVSRNQPNEFQQITLPPLPPASSADAASTVVPVSTSPTVVAALSELLDEIASPFQFTRHHVIRQTTPAQISLKRFYQDDAFRTPQRPNRGWCLDLEVRIREGKHHQIRRMIRRSRLKLQTLCRIQIASILRIESVPVPGDCRWLESWEVDEIYSGLQIRTGAGAGAEGGTGEGGEEGTEEKGDDEEIA
jgi:hypothetical protein